MSNTRKYRAPGPKTMPLKIHQKAQEHWPTFWKKYGKKIREGAEKSKKKYKGNVNQARWAIALIVFKKYCDKRNIPAYTEVIPNTEQNNRRIFIALTDLNKKLGSFVKKLDKTNYLKGTKLTKEVIDNISYVEGNCVITTRCKITLSKEVDRSFMLNNGFKKEGKSFVYTIGNKKIKMKSDGKNIMAYKIVTFTPQQIKSILNVNEDVINNKKEVIKQIGTHIKTKVFKGNGQAGKHLLKAEVEKISNNKRKVPVDFNKLLGENEEIMFKYAKADLTKHNTSDIMNTYNIDYIRSLGSPIYQYNLVKFLVDYFISKDIKPLTLWLAIVEDPSNYLDPIYFEI